MNEEAHPWREDLGAYLVGALDADEAERMRRHLEECPACRAEYAELAPVVGMLASVPAEALAPDAAPVAPPDPAGWERLRARAGLTGVATIPDAAPVRQLRIGLGSAGPGSGQNAAGTRPPGRTRTRRRPLRPTAAAALSGALVAAVAFGVYAGVHQDGGDTAAGTETVSAADAVTGVSGTIQYRPTDWGSSVQITLKGVKPGDDCVLYAMDRAGDKAVASTWWAPYATDGSATIPGGVSMQASDIKTFQVTTTVGQVLLTIPAS